MSDRPAAEQLVPGTPEYEQHLRGDIDHYSRLFSDEEAQERLLEPAPLSWGEAHDRAYERIRERTGDDPRGHVITKLSRRPGLRLLSLGSGPGGLELAFAEATPGSEITCIDVNEELLALGRKRAEEVGLRVSFERADLNTFELTDDDYDYVFCHASLHHLVELEHVARQIRKTLRAGGELLVVDVVTRNGYAMWPETRPIVQQLFRALPAKFRVNHTAYEAPRVDDEIWEADTSEASMECIRSEDILPVLRSHFTELVYVPYWSISRRFFDTMYGPNIDLEQPLDRAHFDWIWELDCHYLDTDRLHPETFFGVYGL